MSSTISDLQASSAEAHRETRRGLMLGLAAYIWWGIAPIYFRALSRVTPLEIVCHRVIWSAIMLVGILAVTKRLPAMWRVAREGRNFLVLVATTILISSNWLVFIRAIEHERILDASLAYFITPLLNVLCGAVFLKERMRPFQKVSLGFAIAGVAWLTWQTGSLPLIPLFLGTTFALYGFLRKTVKAGALDGLTIETLLMTGPALAVVAWLYSQGKSAFFGPHLSDSLLLAMAGVMTAVPLVWFAAAARILRLSTIGFLQYIAPSFQFILAVMFYGEPFDHATAVGFVIVWIGLGIYSWDAIMLTRSRARGMSAEAVPLPE